MSHTVPKRRDGDADDLSVDLSVGIDDRRQLTLDQHHGLWPFAETMANHVQDGASTVPAMQPLTMQHFMRIRGMPGSTRRTVL